MLCFAVRSLQLRAHLRHLLAELAELLALLKIIKIDMQTKYAVLYVEMNGSITENIPKIVKR